MPSPAFISNIVKYESRVLIAQYYLSAVHSTSALIILQLETIAEFTYEPAKRDAVEINSSRKLEHATNNSTKLQHTSGAFPSPQFSLLEKRFNESRRSISADTKLRSENAPPRDSCPLCCTVKLRPSAFRAKKTTISDSNVYTRTRVHSLESSKPSKVSLSTFRRAAEIPHHKYKNTFRNQPTSAKYRCQ